jgi:hypothetical protein
MSWRTSSARSRRPAAVPWVYGSGSDSYAPKLITFHVLRFQYSVSHDGARNGQVSPFPPALRDGRSAFKELTFAPGPALVVERVVLPDTGMGEPRASCDERPTSRKGCGKNKRRLPVGSGDRLGPETLQWWEVTTSRSPGLNAQRDRQKPVTLRESGGQVISLNVRVRRLASLDGRAQGELCDAAAFPKSFHDGAHARASRGVRTFPQLDVIDIARCVCAGLNGSAGRRPGVSVGLALRAPPAACNIPVLMKRAVPPVRLIRLETSALGPLDVRELHSSHAPSSPQMRSSWSDGWHVRRREAERFSGRGWSYRSSPGAGLED